MRALKPDRHPTNKSVEIDEPTIIDPVVQIWAAAFVEINDDLETIQQDVVLDRVEDFRWRDCLFCFAFWRAVSGRGGLREDGCDTHC